MAHRLLGVFLMPAIAISFEGCAASAASDERTCIDDDGAPIACEPVAGDDDAASVVAATPASDLPFYRADEIVALDRAEVDRILASTEEIPLEADPELAAEADERSLASATVRAGAIPGTAIDPGPTDRAELRKLLPIGRTAGVTRFVLLRLRPSDLPSLALGDMLRAAAELQLTTRCDIGQTGPGCGYAPHVRVQLVLTGDAGGTNPHAPGAMALSDPKKLDCTANDHHCMPVIGFSEASRRLRQGDAPPCVASGSCFVNLVAWAYHPDARGGGEDELIVGANEGNFLENGEVEQDRARIMVVRERNVMPADVSLRATRHDVKGAPFDIASAAPERPIYSHAVNGGRDLKAGEKYRIWAEVDASSNHRVNLQLEMFLTKNPHDGDGARVEGTNPAAISEHNGTNCSPGNDCHVRKVAVFEATRDIRGPVFVNVAAATEVPGPGSATTTIHDTGFVKEVRYAR